MLDVRDVGGVVTRERGERLVAPLGNVDQVQVLELEDEIVVDLRSSPEFVTFLSCARNLQPDYSSPLVQMAKC